MILALTGGCVKVRSLKGTRTLTADELNVGPLETSLEPEELITEAIFPALQPGQRAGFDELAPQRRLRAGRGWTDHVHRQYRRCCLC